MHPSFILTFNIYSSYLALKNYETESIDTSNRISLEHLNSSLTEFISMAPSLESNGNSARVYPISLVRIPTSSIAPKLYNNSRA